MTWRKFADFLHSQRLSFDPRLVTDFARIGEKKADTFKRLEKSTRKCLGEAVREFARTKHWPMLSEEETTMLYLRLSYGVDLAMALSTCKTGLFPALKKRDSEMIQWALIEAWDYPGQPHTLRLYSEKRHAFGDDLTRN
jgi:hypothetical protein